MTREEHRERFETLLLRVVRALEMSEEERAPHTRLFARIVEECASERVKALTPWVFDEKPVERSDPLRAYVDQTFGTIVEVAQGWAESRSAQARNSKTRALTHGEQAT